MTTTMMPLVMGLALGAPPAVTPRDPAQLSLTVNHTVRRPRGARTMVLAVLRLDFAALFSPPPPPAAPAADQRRRRACARRRPGRGRQMLPWLAIRADRAVRDALGCGVAP